MKKKTGRYTAHSQLPQAGPGRHIDGVFVLHSNEWIRLLRELQYIQTGNIMSVRSAIRAYYRAHFPYYAQNDF